MTDHHIGSQTNGGGSGTGEGGLGIDHHRVHVTFFKDKYGFEASTKVLTLHQLAGMIDQQTAADKFKLPWLKLAVFGNHRSEGNSLRNDANVIEITGVEGEHDASTMTFDEAVCAMKNAGVRCLLYTSPSYIPVEKERWRVIVPLSRHYHPETRKKYVAWVNGILEGKLSPTESFTLSLSYLYGHIRPDYQVKVIDGDFLDLREDLSTGAIGKPEPEPRPENEYDDDDVDHIADEGELASALAAVPNLIPDNPDDSWAFWSSVGMAIYVATGGSASGLRMFDEWSQKCPEKYHWGNTKKKWAGFKRSPPSRTGAGKIFKMAIEADPGWSQRYLVEIEGKLNAAHDDDRMLAEMLSYKPRAAVEEETVEPKSQTDSGGENIEIGGSLADAAAKPQIEDQQPKTSDQPPQTAAGGEDIKVVDGLADARDHKTESPKTADQPQQQSSTIVKDPLGRSGTALSAVDWIARDLPPQDFICGKWLTTVSRSILYAPTGIGKTMFALALAMALAAGKPFMHWHTARPIRVLYIDGEMSRTLMKKRIEQEAKRLGVTPPNLFVLSHEDVKGFPALNTSQGQAFIDSTIKKIGGVDLVIFDNIMSLISGSMKETESWAKTLTWVMSLTARRIATFWIHHTGHDESHSYGDKTKEWGLNNLIRLEKVERNDTDVSFLLKFEKAREKEPETRSDFEDVRVTLVADTWIWSKAGSRQEKPSPMGAKFYKTLWRICDQTINGHRAATIEAWREACFGQGFMDRDHPSSARALFSKYRLELIQKNWIASNETEVWTIGPDEEEEVF